MAKRKRKAAAAVDLTAITNRAAFSIKEFCARHGACRQTLENWRQRGLAPHMMKIHGRVLISAEAEREWHQRLETNPLPLRGHRAPPSAVRP